MREFYEVINEYPWTTVLLFTITFKATNESFMC